MIADRRRMLDHRDFHEQLLNRARFLDPADRVLVEQVLAKGVLPREVAVVAGRSTRSVQRRLRQVLRRLNDPQVLTVLRMHERWDPILAQVALAVWVRRWTLRQTAARLNLSLHQVRQHTLAIRTLLQAALSPEPSLPAFRSSSSSGRH
jgi:DNA-directed RNA polymerase specialized sigma24 family protein